jgi:peptidoglycan/xylan/chitin deacetylase (PgdA/CDA1 family)
MEWLRREGYPVLDLGTALSLLTTTSLPAGATVITIDDGWYGTYRSMFPVLRELGMPATLYVATYYVEKQTQVFNMAVQYVLWRAQPRILQLTDLAIADGGRYDLAVEAERQAAAGAIEAVGEEMSGPERQQLWRRLCGVLGLDCAALEGKRVMKFVNLDECRAMAEEGIDLQLHTHRHRLRSSDGYEDVLREISDNRGVIAGVATRSLEHFCYPSGQYQPHQIPWLRSMGISSATTCNMGLNGPDTPRMELRRFLDSESISLLRFEAELSGFVSIVRKILRKPR